MSSLNVNAINGVDVQNLASKVARAWVNFNGVGVVAIRKALNVSSITDNGTGLFVVNFATPMPDANFVGVGNSSNSSGHGAALLIDSAVTSVVAPTINSMAIVLHASGLGVQDNLYVNMAFFD